MWCCLSTLVKYYMKKEVPTTEDKSFVSEAAKTMIKSSRGFLIVLKEGKPEGIVTEHDFVEKVIAKELDPSKVIISGIMSSPIITIDPDEDLLKASELMKKHNIRRLPVVKDGIIYGVLTTRDVSQQVREYVDKSVRDIIRWVPLGL